MKIKRNVGNIPENGRKLSEEARLVVEFMDSDDKNIKFECGGKQEATRVYSNTSSVIRKHGLAAKAMRRGNDIYVVRVTGGVK